MSTLFELLAGLVLIYFLLSMLVSSIVEVFQTRIKSRSRLLYDALSKVLNDKTDPNRIELFYRHPLIAHTKQHPGSLPSYIEAGTFAQTIFDLVAANGRPTAVKYDESDMPHFDDGNDNKNTFAQFESGLNTMSPGDLKTLLHSFLINSEGAESLRTNMEQWYDGYMDRVAGWYKRYLRKSLFIAACFVTVLLNVDTIRVVQALWQDDALRSELYAVALQVGNDSTLQRRLEYLPAEQRIDSIVAIVERNEAMLKSMELKELPLGWITEVDGRITWQKFRDLICKNLEAFSFQTSVGWLITALLLRQGAPFWFEILKKLVNLRGTGPKPETAS
jgi:hypothetical protein